MKGERSIYENQTVFVATKLPGFMRISCATVFLFVLGACGPSNGADSGSGSSDGSTGATPQTMFLAANDGVNGVEFWKTDSTAAGAQFLKDICPGSCDGPMSYSGLG